MIWIFKICSHSSFLLHANNMIYWEVILKSQPTFMAQVKWKIIILGTLQIRCQSPKSLPRQSLAARKDDF